MPGEAEPDLYGGRHAEQRSAMRAIDEAARQRVDPVAFLSRLYGQPDRVAQRREAFLRGDGPPLLLDPVSFFGALGMETAPEAVEQLRRDRDRLIDDARD